VQPAIEWIDESITVGVDVDDESQLVFIGGQEGLEGSCFNFGEGSWSGEVGVAWVLECGFGIGGSPCKVVNPPSITLEIDNIIYLTKIYCKIPVQVYTALRKVLLCLTLELWIHVFPFCRYLVILCPMALNVGYSIHVEYGHEKVLVLLQKLLVGGILLQIAQLNELEELVDDHRGGDHLTSVCGACKEDGWLLAAHYVGIGEDLVTQSMRRCRLLLFVIIVIILVSLEESTSLNEAFII